jgi:hypothetical protein
LHMGEQDSLGGLTGINRRDDKHESALVKRFKPEICCAQNIGRISVARRGESSPANAIETAFGEDCTHRSRRRLYMQKGAPIPLSG